MGLGWVHEDVSKKKTSGWAFNKGLPVKREKGREILNRTQKAFADPIFL